MRQSLDAQLAETEAQREAHREAQGDLERQSAEKLSAAEETIRLLQAQLADRETQLKEAAQRETEAQAQLADREKQQRETAEREIEQGQTAERDASARDTAERDIAERAKTPPPRSTVESTAAIAQEDEQLRGEEQEETVTVTVTEREVTPQR